VESEVAILKSNPPDSSPEQDANAEAWRALLARA